MYFVKRVALLAAVLACSACQELVIDNTNAPDRKQALDSPAAVELLVASSYPVLYNRIYRGTAGYIPLPMTSDEGTNSDNTAGARDLSTLPRRPYDNNPVNDDQYALVQLYWRDFYQVFSNSVDVLKVVNDGLVIETGNPVADNTHRLKVFAKLFQGISLSLMAIAYDQGYVYDEDTPTAVIEDPIGNGLGLVPYGDVAAKALQLLQTAIQQAEGGPDFTIPAAWLYAPADVSRADIIELAHAWVARLLVLTPRTPAERQTVNWQAVLDHTAKVTKDVRVAFGATSTGQNNNYIGKAHSTTSNSRWYVSNLHIGAADVSGNFQTWLTTPAEQRARFLITTPDRRITGPGGPTSNGLYFRYVTTNLVNSLYGTYRESFYQWSRYATSINVGATSGTFSVLPLDELKLYRAEAFFRMGQLQQAVDIINTFRAKGSLPAITTAGVAASPTCVPKTRTGACGSLLDALAYERNIELAFVDPIRVWADKRGFGLLTTGTILHLPLPYEQQRILGMPYYTYGGSGPGSAQ
jgi:hypothetical protein